MSSRASDHLAGSKRGQYQPTASYSGRPRCIAAVTTTAQRHMTVDPDSGALVGALVAASYDGNQFGHIAKTIDISISDTVVSSFSAVSKGQFSEKV